ncbi:hypothetical protein [Streptomyces sp. NBC_01190]|uniref:hypothetical protein n=1 Tax=Streptomyces sp. NBC_01190 TaxID=2903767 RepID=UPI00386E54B4|nr:hypothetical protein OG519_03980 [Streptomyces sp. NBC_01190]
MTEPTFPSVMARASDDFIPVLVTADMKSWPTRWACDIAPRARSTQLAGDALALGDAEVGLAPPDAEVEGAAVVGVEGAAVAGGVAEGEGAALCPSPQPATVTSRPRVTAESAGRRSGRRREAFAVRAARVAWVVPAVLEALAVSAARAVLAVVGSRGMFGWRTAEPHTS